MEADLDTGDGCVADRSRGENSGVSLSTDPDLDRRLSTTIFCFFAFLSSASFFFSAFSSAWVFFLAMMKSSVVSEHMKKLILISW